MCPTAWFFLAVSLCFWFGWVIEIALIKRRYERRIDVLRSSWWKANAVIRSQR